MDRLLNSQLNDFKDASTVASKIRTYFRWMPDRNDTELAGVDTGYTELNRTGFGKGDLILIASRPSVGTTSLALNITQNLLNKGKGVAIASLEMSAEVLTLHLLSIQTSIQVQRLRQNNINTEEKNRLDEAMEKMENSKLFIHDQKSINVYQLSAKLRDLKRQNPEIELAVIDCLQMIGKQSEENIGEIMQQLKILACKLETPIIVISKLGSSLESRINKRPILSDIPRADSIEPYADTILFLYRDDLYLYGVEKEREKKAIIAGREFIGCYVEKEEEEVEVIVGKNRNGPTGHIKLLFLKKFMRFAERYSFANIQVVHEMVKR